MTDSDHEENKISDFMAIVAMTSVDCAGDNEIAEDLSRYLRSHGLEVKLEESVVIVDKADLEQILRSFLEERGKKGYKIRKIDSENLLVSREVPIEDLGFLRCEMCGHVVSSEEELLVHRRAHGIQLL